MRLSVRAKIILPFAVLLLLIGVVSTGLASTQMATAASAQFDAGLLSSTLTANQTLSQLDTARTADLRLATDTVGVSEALAAGQTEALSRLLLPVVGNVTAKTAVLSIVDLQGRDVLRIEDATNHDGTVSPSVVSLAGDSGFAAEPEVVRVLEATGSANLRLAFVSGGMVYWVGPVRLASEQTVGAALLGESLAEIAKGIPGSALYDLLGGRLASVLPNPPTLGLSA